ncbi:MAG: DUF3418 domain-containing protein, partial [Kiritimatiellae bacterium]|nr:DUF3418 domain-containing protein [Kiritimatiellia bacterium]
MRRPTTSGAEPTEKIWQLTPIGRTLATFPVEPRFARILIAAEAECALRDALTVVAAMACDDPLLRPLDKTAQADQQHTRFRCANSDFNGRLRLWEWWHDASQGISETQRRKRCKAAFISYPKMREWANIRAQLEDLCREKRLHVNDHQGGEVGLHRALLCGLLSRIGHYDSETKEYRGAFAVKFNLFPGSALAKAARKESHPTTRQSPKRKPSPEALPESKEWVLAGELVETSRLFGRTVACIDPRWIEPIAGSLCKIHRHSPYWDRDKGFVRIHEDVTLFGLPIASGRRRDLSRIDPVYARKCFIADALCVPDALQHPPKWLQENWRKQRLLEQLSALRRSDRDALREALLAFYDSHLPADICNAPTLKHAPALYLRGDAFEVDAATLKDFPATQEIGGATFPLVYTHEPKAIDDGVSIIATPDNLHLLQHWHGEWLVPGLLPEKILWMLNALPSRVRHTLGNLVETQEMLLSKVHPYTRPLSETLFRLLRDERGISVDETPWEEERLPNHLRLNIKVMQENSLLGQGRNLAPLIELFATHKDAPTPKASTLADPALARLANHQECLEKLKEWGGNRWSNYAQFPSLTPPVKAFLKEAAIDVARLGQSMFTRILEETFLQREDPQTEADLATRYSACKGRIAQIAADWRRRILYILAETTRLEHRAQTQTGIYPETSDDILEQLAWLVFDGFVTTVPPEMLAYYPALLKGIDERLERARNNPSGDRRKMESIAPFWKRYLDFIQQAKKPRHNPIALSRYRWAIESLRLTTFCPTAQGFEKTSAKQLDALWQMVLQ